MGTTGSNLPLPLLHPFLTSIRHAWFLNPTRSFLFQPREGSGRRVDYRGRVGGCNHS